MSLKEVSKFVKLKLINIGIVCDEIKKNITKREAPLVSDSGVSLVPAETCISHLFASEMASGQYCSSAS